MEKLKKSVKIGDTVYSVRVEEGFISAEETTYPLPGYGNNFGTEYTIDLDYSKGWAKATVNCYNNTWATRGHGMTDYWTDSVGYIRKGEAKEFYNEVVQELKEAEDGTPDVKDVFDKVKAKVEEVAYEEDEDY